MDLLWKKEWSRDGEVYVDLFANLPADKLRSDSQFCRNIDLLQRIGSRFHAKNDVKSLEFRNQGNVKFNNQDWWGAMVLYNQSLCFAEKNSANVSLAYANRSSCFLRLRMFTKCLADIQLAIITKYPPSLMPKLLNRRADCLSQMKVHSELEYCVPQLSYEEDPNFQGMANVLEIKYNEEFGRHIVAKCDLPAGQTVLVDEAFIAINGERYNRCASCLRTTMNFIPCNNCSNAIYCDDACARAAFIHPIECDANLPDVESVASEVMSYVIDTINRVQNVEELIDFVENAIEQPQWVPSSFNKLSNRYQAFFQLQDAKLSDTMGNVLRSSNIVYSLMFLSDDIQQVSYTKNQKRFLMHLVTYFMCALANTVKHADAVKLLTLISSYIHHSCAPNIMFAGIANKVFAVTVRPIKMGERLSKSYSMDYIGSKPIGQWQEEFYQQFGIQCTCERCEPNIENAQNNSYNIQMDEDYKFVADEINQNPNYDFNETQIAVLQNKIVGLFNHYGDKHWCQELGCLMEVFKHIYMSRIVVLKNDCAIKTN